MDLQWVFYDMHTPQATGSAQKMFFVGFICNPKASIPQKLYIILNWLPFQNDEKAHLSINA